MKSSRNAKNNIPSEVQKTQFGKTWIGRQKYRRYLCKEKKKFMKYSKFF